MTNLEYAKLDSYNNISALLETHQKELAAVPGMIEFSKKFQLLNKDLNALANQNAADLKKLTGSRRKSHETLVKSLYALNYPMVVWAQLNSKIIDPGLL